MNERRGRGMRIIVQGHLVRGPLGGRAWNPLQYVVGLDRLGYEVCFLEDSGDVPWSCYDPTRSVTDRDPTYGLQFAATIFERVGLGDCWAYYDAHTSRWFGPCAENIRERCANAELLLNLGLSNPMRPWTAEIPVRVLVDTDPAFTQVSHLTDNTLAGRAQQHTAFFSFGENIGKSGCFIPNDGFPWQPTRLPLVPDLWPMTPGSAQGAWTTVMHWNGGGCEYGGVRYGMKNDSFSPYLDLPERVRQLFTVALGRPTAARQRLQAHGWVVTNPLEATRDPWTYQQFLRDSKAEFSVAKHGYVISRSGWFSERSVGYLASGRPAVLQDTGFSDWLPTGSGVISFHNPEEAIAGIQEISRRYEFHCKAAREIAEEYFEATKVLSHLIERAMNPTPTLKEGS